MRQAAALLVAAGLALTAVVVPARASTSAEVLLVQAEALRSSNPERFQRTLAELGAADQRLTASQRERLEYLRAYARAYGGDYAAAAAMAKQLLRSTDDIAMRFRAGSLVVNSHSATGRFTEALRQLEENMLLFDRIDDPDLRHQGLFVAAQMYSRVGQEELSLEYARKILDGSPSPRARCFAEQISFEASMNLGALPVGDAPIVRVIQQCHAAGEPITAGMVRGLLARKWASGGEQARAAAMLRAHLPEIEATGFPRLIGATHSLLAEYLLDAGELASAEAHVQKAFVHRASLTHSPALVAAHRVRYEIARQRGDPVAALVHYRSFAEADKAYLDDVKMRELAFQVMRHETQQKMQQIALLRQKNEMLRLQQRVQNQASQNMGLAVVVLTLLLGGIAYWAYKVKRVHLTLRRFAQTDVLTGISNRHHFTQQARRSLEQCEVGGVPAALIMFDLDRFKAINDTYGHDAGDWALKQVASTCAGLCRRIDRFARVGGEEFAILLHGCEIEAAQRLAEDCRVRLNQIDSRPTGHTFPVTASFGVTSTACSGYSLAALMTHADLGLYRAKREGRNMVRAYTGDLPVASARDSGARMHGDAAPQPGQRSDPWAEGRLS